MKPKILYLVTLSVFCIILAAIITPRSILKSVSKATDQFIESDVLEEALKTIKDPTSRRIYPYSIVSGGTHTTQELKSAINRDPVVAKHYADFKVEKAVLVEAKAPMILHASYRIGDRVYWTKKKLHVAKGERLLTDGANFSRTRCANRLSEVPVGEVSPEEPSEETFDEPVEQPKDSMPPSMVYSKVPNVGVDPVDNLPFMPLAKLDVGEPPIIPEPVSTDSTPKFSPPPPPPPPVPEPNLTIILIIGLTGLCLGKRFFK